MNKVLSTLLILGCFLYPEPSAFSGNSAQQTVQFAVGEINEVSVSGDPETMYVAPGEPGKLPPEVSESSTTYNITTTSSNKKITVHLTQSSYDPTLCYLKVNLQAPQGATSPGDVQIPGDNSSANVVTGISKVSQSGLRITYKFRFVDLDSEKLQQSSFNFLVNFTLTDS
jgi:hypothetical protein